MHSQNNDLFVRARMAELARVPKTRPPARGSLRILLDARRARRHPVR
jgi:hypothetical protein